MFCLFQDSKKQPNAKLSVFVGNLPFGEYIKSCSYLSNTKSTTHEIHENSHSVMFLPEIKPDGMTSFMDFITTNKTSFPDRS